MKYILVDDATSSRCAVFTEEYETAEQAIEAGKSAWDRLTGSEKRERDSFYVLESVNPDEDAEDHFDGDVVFSWK